MLRDCKFELSYSSGLQHGPKEFFTEALIESKSFDLGLGFFSSSAINSLADGFALFIAQGGKMRVIINDVLTKEDKQAIKNDNEISFNEVQISDPNNSANSIDCVYIRFDLMSDKP